MEQLHDQTHLLQSADQLKLLDEIDKLRSQGIAHYVSLPQLIVCGDQSSGKSSVLEAISGISFPTKDNLCTRFATEVILRKASTVSVSVHLIPSKSRSPAEEARLKNFNETLKSLDDFAPLVDKAKEVMGISDTTGAFSNDVLRVEISGPDRPHLTIVDLPGLIHSENKSQSRADVALVWKMVRNYMENKRSIILAVVSAKNDYANQAVLKLAKEVDNEGNRTFGIITKPDTLSIGSESEAGFISLARNEDIRFRLGWHVVRNRNYEERDQSTESRDATEVAFFSRGAWKDLSRAMVGINTLRTRLSKVLLDQIKASLPALVEDIQKSLEDCETKLTKLGSERTTLHEQRMFLLQIGQAFQALARAAIDGVYDNPFFGDPRSDLGYSKRLRAVIQNLNLEFASRMRKDGQQRRIIDEENVSDRDSITSENAITREDFEAEILELLRSSRGRELPGMFNPLIVGEIFHQQAQPWEHLARDHAQETWAAVRTFLSLALADLTDENTLDGLFREIINPLTQQRLQSLNNKLDEVLLPHIQGHPITYNHYFTETIQSIRQQRQEKHVIDRLGSLFGNTNPENFRKGVTVQNIGASHTKLPDILSALTGPKEANMDKYACSEILLCMEAYYKVAMKLLVDNVAVQTIEACLLTQLPNIISPISVMGMDDDTVSRIAAEPEENQAAREQLMRKQTILKAGLDICNRYTRHQTTTKVTASKTPVENPWRRGRGTKIAPASDTEEEVKAYRPPWRSSSLQSVTPRRRSASPPMKEPTIPIFETVRAEEPQLEESVLDGYTETPKIFKSTKGKKGKKARSFPAPTEELWFPGIERGEPVIEEVAYPEPY